MTIYLRNCNPRRSTLVPVAPGWARVVPPQATSAVPAAALASPHVQHALADQRLSVVTEVTASVDARNALALRTDLARAIAEAERREFARLIAQQERQGRAVAPRRLLMRRQRPEDRKRRADEWPDQRVEQLRARCAEGAGVSRIAAELGISRGTVYWKIRHLGLRLARQRPEDRERRADEWPAGRVERLKARWAEGATASVIAAELGITRVAVCGKARRLGLPMRKPASAQGR